MTLCFVDDLLIFCKTAPSTVQKVLGTFNEFSGVSGLGANQLKSSMYMGGIPEAQKRALLALTGFSKGKFLMLYLGIPLIAKKWSKSECFSLVQKMTAKLDLWSARNLSYAG